MPLDVNNTGSQDGRFVALVFACIVIVFYGLMIWFGPPCC